MVLASLLKRLSVAESCTADWLQPVSAGRQARQSIRSEEEHGILAICGKYKVSLRSVFRFKSY
jgi:hypothetical protein